MFGVKTIAKNIALAMPTTAVALPLRFTFSKAEFKDLANTELPEEFLRQWAEEIIKQLDEELLNIAFRKMKNY